MSTMTNRNKCLIGAANLDDATEQVLIQYYPTGSYLQPIPEICVLEGQGPHCRDTTRTPREILHHRPKYVRKLFKDGKLVPDGIGYGPEDWFIRKCKASGCTWFVPLVERMATGEVVGMDEVFAAYRANNAGRELPCVPLDSQFQKARV